MSAGLKGDLAQARRHIELLTGSPDTLVYARLIYERTDKKRPAENHYGTVADLWPAIEDAQQRGFAAYIQVNGALPPEALQEPAKLSPKAGEIVRVRALVCDKDGDKHRDHWSGYYGDERGAAVRWQDQDWHVQPDLLVIRDDTHYHPYWLTRDLPVIQLRHFEWQLAAHYGADPAVIDLPRILRLAGTWHQKPGKPPSMVTLQVPEWTEGRLSLAAEMTDSPVSALARDTDTLTAGLQHMRLAEPANLSAAEPADDPRALTVATYRKLLSFIDPTFSGDRSGWFGIMRFILDGRARLLDGEDLDREALAVEWSRGDLWRERTGDAGFVVSTYAYDLDGECIHDVRASAATSGPRTGLGTLAHYANANGFVGDLDERGAEERYGGALAAVTDEFVNLLAPSPTPDFPLDALIHGDLRRFVEEKAHTLGADYSALASAVLNVAGGAIDHRVELNLRLRSEYLASARHWTMLVADSGTSRKTGILNAAVAPLQKLESRRYARYRDALAAYELWKKKGLIENGLDIEAGEPTLPEKLIMGETTIEHLAETLMEQDRGVFVFRDEMSGWIANLERYNGSSDRGHWLALREGGGYPWGRVKTGGVHINNFSASLLCGIQPERLAELISLTTDGLLQRFLPTIVRGADLPRDEPDAPSVQAYAQLIERLTTIRPGHTLRVDEEGYAVWREIETWLLTINKGIESGAFRSAVAKLNSAFGAFAVILHLVNDEMVSPVVPAATLRAAARIINEFTFPSLRAFYSREAGQMAVRAMASYVLTSWRDTFTIGRLRNDVAPLRGLPDHLIAQHATTLVVSGWLVDEDRFGRAWRVHPGLRAHFAQLRRDEIERKAAVEHAMNARGKFR